MNIDEVKASFLSIRRECLFVVLQLVWYKKDSVHRILKKDLGFHSYKLQMLQELEEDDSEKREVFAEKHLEHMEHDQNFLKNLFFLDEAHFHLHGGVNTYDFRYWINTNPHFHSVEPKSQCFSRRWF